MNMLIVREFGEHQICQRQEGGYMDATAMCKANKKRWHNYWQNKATQEFLAALAAVTGIPVTELVQVKQSGKPSEQGTYVHPLVAANLAQWCSPKFSVVVAGWVDELRTTGKVDITQTVPKAVPPLPPSPVKEPTTAVVVSSPLTIQLSEGQDSDPVLAQLRVMADLRVAQIACDSRLGGVEAKVDAMVKTVADALRELSGDDGYYTVIGWANVTNQTVEDSAASAIGRKLSALARQRGIPLKKAFHKVLGEINRYPKDFLLEQLGDGGRNSAGDQPRNG